MRGVRRADIDAYAATMADPAVYRQLTGKPFSREDSWRRLMMAVGQWPLLGYGYWAAELKANGRMVGQVGFADFERDMQPNISGEPEMGWIFDRSVHGQGIAREACEAALAWFESEFGPTEIPAIISIGNEPSMKLAERLDFVREPDGIYKNEPIAIYRRPARQG